MGKSKKEVGVTEAAQITGLSKATIREYIAKGILVGARLIEPAVGRSYYVIPESSLRNFTPPPRGRNSWKGNR